MLCRSFRRRRDLVVDAETMTRLGWVGIGAMGAPLAARLARASLDARRLPLKVFDVNANAMKKHTDEYGSVAVGSLEELGHASDIIFLSLPTTAHVKEVCTVLKATLSADSVVVDTTSGDPVPSPSPPV